MEIRRPAQDDPLQRFLALLERAKATPHIVEPTAMTLATVGADGRPSARVVLLKDADEDGLVFYTNLDSRKGREALARPDVALLFWWGPLESQVRFEGRAERVSDEEADAYFATRARGSQLGAWASAQSRPLASRAELEGKLADLEAARADEEQALENYLQVCADLADTRTTCFKVLCTVMDPFAQDNPFHPLAEEWQQWRPILVQQVPKEGS